MQVIDQQDQYTPSFLIPLHNEHNTGIFEAAQEARRTRQFHQSLSKGQQQDQDISFVFTNLDTGESNITNVRQSLIRTQSFQTKEFSKEAWNTFWKKVYRKNEELRAACEMGDLNRVRNIVENKESDYPIDVNSKGFDNWTALHFASYQDHTLIVQYLLQHGSQINSPTRFGKTALHIACLRGNTSTVHLLISSGININTQDQDGNTALHIATQSGYQEIIQQLASLNPLIIKNNNNQSPFTLIPQSADKIKEIFQKHNLKSEGQSSAKNSKLLNVIVRTSLNNTKLTPEFFSYYKLLGKGSFGEVFLVRRNGDEELYAMKVLNKQTIFKRGLVKYAMVERNIMSVMNHPFIVKLNYSFQSQSKLFLVMEYCSGKDLGKLLAKKKILREEEARFYLSQLVLAFEALHKNMIVFRDLKPENVLLDEQGHVKLTDFGLSKQGVYNNTIQSFCGSIAYLAPEILARQGHTRTVDWYLVGVLAYEMMVGLPPYYNDKKQVLLENIKKAALHIPKTLSQPAKDLMRRLLERDPLKRLGSERDASELRQHPFFSGIDWIDVMNKKLPAPPVESIKVDLSETLKVCFDDKKQSKESNRLERWTYISNK